MKALLTIPALILLTGCASSGEYRDYLTAQHAANELAMKEQKPLFRLTAQDGQAITGLKSIEIYTPQAPTQIQQARPSEWAGVIGQGLSVVGALGGVYLGGQAATNLADSVGRSSGQGFQYVNPTPIVAPATQVVRPEVVQPVVVTTPAPEVVQIPTQVIDQPVIVPVAGGF